MLNSTSTSDTPWSNLSDDVPSVTDPPEVVNVPDPSLKSPFDPPTEDASDPKISSKASWESIARVIEPVATLLACRSPRTTRFCFAVITSAVMFPSTVSVLFVGSKNSLSFKLNLPPSSK